MQANLMNSRSNGGGGTVSPNFGSGTAGHHGGEHSPKFGGEHSRGGSEG